MRFAGTSLCHCSLFALLGVLCFGVNLQVVMHADTDDGALPHKINEQWLLHGSCFRALGSICARGFDMRLARSDRYGQVLPHMLVMRRWIRTACQISAFNSQ